MRNIFGSSIFFDKEYEIEPIKKYFSISLASQIKEQG